jgi:hypothetical protein
MQPAIVDAHTHLGRWLSPTGDWIASDLAGSLYDSWMHADVGELLSLMDTCGIATCVNLDGRWDAELEANLDRYDRAHPDRFLTFCQLDWLPKATTSATGSRRACAARPPQARAG